MLGLPEIVCCSVLQCVAVCCSVLQCVAVCCSVNKCLFTSTGRTYWPRQAASCVLQFAVCCSVLQCVAVRCSVLKGLLTSTGCGYQRRQATFCPQQLIKALCRTMQPPTTSPSPPGSSQISRLAFHPGPGMYTCMYIRTDVRINVRTCICLCMYVRMYVCICVLDPHSLAKVG